jgi:DNA-binding beta-propeller fold protein YncE
VMGTNLDPIKDQLGDYVGNKFRLNWWYPEDYKNMDWGTPLRTLLDPDARAKLVKYVLYRELINPPLGARDMYFYVRKDLARGGGIPSDEAGPVSSPVVSAPLLQQPQGQEQPQAQAAAAVDFQGVTTYGRPGGQAVLRDPKGIASDRDGRLYVVDGANSTVTIFNRDGSVASSWGRKGAGSSEFNEPWGVAVGPDGSVFVADTWNHRIQKFTAGGQLVTQWGGYETGTAPGKFYGPRDVAITPAGEVLVTDTGNKRIQVFDQQGTFLRAFGSEGSGPGQFREPVGLAVDRLGRIYVADTWNQRIQVFDASFQAVAQYEVQGWGSQNVSNKPYLAVGPDGDVYATVPERRTVVQLKDGAVRTVALPISPRLTMPTGVDLAADGRLLVSDSQSGVVLAYDLASQAPESSGVSGQAE